MTGRRALLPGRRADRGVPPLPEGAELLPGYRVIARMAHGKRLDTYDAWDLDRDCRVVVKVLREDRLDEPDVVAAVLQEGRLVTSLAHPHLVRGLAVVDRPRPAMVLELLTGATLDALVEESPLAVDDVAQLGVQLCSVLGYLHRRDWLHLDLKPANVVVDRGRAVLIDLSLAGRPGEGRRGAGTPGYHAPEQAAGRDVSPATDVWGLGATLLEALTGELPHGSEVVWGRRRQPRPPRPRPVPAGTPAPFGTLLHACLDPDPAARPTVAEVRSVLRDLLGPAAGPG